MRMPWERLAPFIADAVKGAGEKDIYEIRIRLSQPIEICREDGNRLVGGPVTKEQITLAVASLTGHSVYACESQMREGFFTLPGGARVGLTGRCANSQGEIQYISSLSIRIPRSVSSDGAKALRFIAANGRVKSCLILSAPGMGKTTLLRALVQGASEMGLHVAVCDERDELSGGDSLGSRVDVAANCPKHIAIPKLVRAMSPDIIATDEIGRPEDADTIADAKRCGCDLLATAHASDYKAARERETLKLMIEGGIFDRFIELTQRPGHISRILGEGGKELWTDGR